MKYLLFIPVIFLLTSCHDDNFEQSEIQLSTFDSTLDHIIISNELISYSLNFTENSEWFKGDIFINNKTRQVHGIKFDKQILSELSIGDASKENFSALIDDDKFIFYDFNLKGDILNFSTKNSHSGLTTHFSIKNDHIINPKTDSPITAFISTITRAKTISGSDYQGELKCPPCVIGIVAGVAAVATATVNHCTSVVEAVADNCSACVTASFCSATCHPCPPPPQN